jgi:group II intron reverse transcriptase/maturase
MRTAEAILGVISDRGRRGLPLEDVYRQMFNPNLYLLAYGRIATNKGAMTPGTTPETADGMATKKIEQIIGLLRNEKYRWSPARRVNIPKRGGKTRPLGVPTWSDKLLQEVIRLILEAYYEPQFSNRSHGFRPGRGCHTALREVKREWAGTIWFIEGDIEACFDSLDHQVLLKVLAEKVHDGRFLRLIESLLKAGYVEDWTYHRTYSGTPQGGVVSPILSNIYLDRLDKHVEEVLVPAYTWGEYRRSNPAYLYLNRARQVARERGDSEKDRRLRKVQLRMPSKDTHDPLYRRLRYIRYADDFLLGFAGPRAEAEAIKQQVAEFLANDLGLTLSDEKTLITHARSSAARFLGYEVVVMHDDNKQTVNSRGVKKRSISGAIGLKVPLDVIQDKCRPYMANGKPTHRPERLNDDEYSIVEQYGAEYRGLVEYYRMAHNLHRLGYYRWVLETSMTKTLANKLKVSVAQVYQRYWITADVDGTTLKVFRVAVPREGKKPLIATFGDTRLAHSRNTVLIDSPRRVLSKGQDTIRRMQVGVCELCGSTEQIEVHHVRSLKAVRNSTLSEWKQQMIARQRKTLVVCKQCHEDIHHPTRLRRNTGEPDEAKVSRPVRREA